MLSAFTTAVAHRASFLADCDDAQTDCYRLLHGTVEGVPGVAVDRYGPVLLVQTWREPLGPEVLDALVEHASAAVGTPLQGVHNHRARPVDFERWHPLADPPIAQGKEAGLAFDVSPRHRGRDPLLFLDLRHVRRRVRAEADGHDVLNLFAYTCGVGVAAAAGGAASVLNVDFARSALTIGERNAARNGLAFDTLPQDCFPVMRQLAGLKVGRGGAYQRMAPRTFGLVILDPPRRATSRFGTVDLMRDYPSVFKPALLSTAPGGVIVATNNLASVDLDDWVDILKRCANKAGRPLRSIEIMTPDPDFPSPDDRHPLKVAWCGV